MVLFAVPITLFPNSLHVVFSVDDLGFELSPLFINREDLTLELLVFLLVALQRLAVSLALTILLLVKLILFS